MENATLPDPTVTTPKERIWYIDCYVRAQDGTLIPDPAEVERAMIAAGNVLSLIGGVMSIASVREEIEPGRVVTTRMMVRWQSFVPKVSGVVTDSPTAEPVAEAPTPPADPEPSSSNGTGPTGD
jgi:hypothetical protein